uniref:18 kDa Sin3-associated polypeptide n=1 Tax=Acrobeloides nanus TaxID=290746 RepID=A0A914DI98_9BILA
MALIKDVNAEARVRGTEFDFAIVTPDRNSPRYIMRDIGVTINGQRGVDDSKTLEQCKFEVGDYIDVAIRLPRLSGGGGGRGGGGDRGFYGGDRGGGRFGGRDRDREFRGGRDFQGGDRYRDRHFGRD